MPGGYAVSLAGVGDRLVVGGQFQSIGGVSAQNIAAWNGQSWESVGTTAGRVDSIAQFQGDLIAGTEYGVFRWNGGWQSVPSSPGSARLRGTLRSLLSDGESLYVTGSFYATDSQGPSNRFHNIAVYRGTDWMPLGDGLQNQGGLTTGEGVTLAKHGSDVIVGGYFDSAGGVTAESVARWDGTAWHSMDTGFDGVVRSFATIDGELFVGGGWRADGRGTMQVARWDGTQWAPPTSASDGWITCSVAVDGTTFAGGEFQYVDGVRARHIARRTGGAWEPLGAGIGFVGTFSGMTLHQGDLFVAATSADDAATSIMRWDGSEWTEAAGGIHGSVYSMYSVDDQLVIGGSFAGLNGTAIENVARWDGTQWLPMGVSHGNIRDFQVHEGTLYAAGSFGPPPADVGYRGTVAAWNGTEWEPLALAPGNSSGALFESLESYRGDLIAAGMNWADGYPMASVWRWNGADWEAVAGTPSGRTIDMAVFGGRLVVVGQYGGYCWYNLCETTARTWDGSMWSELDVRGNIYTATATESGVFFGGEVLQAGGVVSGPWADWRPNGACCDSIDFNRDSLFPDIQDIEDFVAVLAGGTCAQPNPAHCNDDIDFNNDTMSPDAEDVQSLLRVFAGGVCE